MLFNYPNSFIKKNSLFGTDIQRYKANTFKHYKECVCRISMKKRLLNCQKQLLMS